MIFIEGVNMNTFELFGKIWNNESLDHRLAGSKAGAAKNYSTNTHFAKRIYKGV